jgi:6-phosphogluconolactonase
MQTTRRSTFRLLSLVFAMGGLAANALPTYAAGDDDASLRSGKIFTSTNAAAGNEVLVFDQQDGKLVLQTRLATQGQGTGTGLGNQGAVTLSGNGRYLFVVNAQSNTVSTFAVRHHRLTLESTVESGGQRPVSVTEHDGVVYVLNADGAGNVAGFRNSGGKLSPLAGSVRALSAVTATGAAQVGFSPDGEVLVVTEKATNKLTTYQVGPDGLLGVPMVNASSGMTPFGFAFDRRGNLLVSEAFGGAANASALSSYGFENWAPAKPMLISPSVGTTQTAACWVVVTPRGKYAYTTNTASGTISSFTVHRDGKLMLSQAVAATTGAGPIDAAISMNGRQLFVLNGGAHTLSSFSVARDGTLSTPVSVDGLPVGANGLAAN